jgi:bifunctional non-homologous end joining protein LigD
MWPRVGVTKGEMVDYYVRIADMLLPHLAGHPLTLHRFPEGVGGPHFFQTRTPPHPPWVATATMHMPRTGKTFEACIVDDLPGLVWAANMLSIELHPFLGRVGSLDRPVAAVFDLDPGPPAGLVDCCEIALLIRALLEDVGLVSLVKTSGGKGLHIYVPFNGSATYDDTKALAHGIAQLLTRHHSDRVVDRMDRSLRAGKVFVDWSQNDPGKSTVVAYSLRGLDVPTVSLPVTWEEVEEALAAGDPSRLAFGPAETLERVQDLGDLFAPTLTVVQQPG